MLVRSIFPIVGLMACLALFVAAQQKEIRQVPIKATSPTSATEMYTAYCAVCHGVDGKGNGPAAEALRVRPPDLTTLAKKNGGKISVRPRYNRYPWRLATGSTRHERNAGLGRPVLGRERGT
jgi:mono/diheme cytochrome c family protein